MNRTIMRDEERFEPTRQNTRETLINTLPLEPIDHVLRAAKSRLNDSWLQELQAVDLQHGQPTLQTSEPKNAIPISKSLTRLGDHVLEIKSLVISPRRHDLTPTEELPRAS